jgi:hypothetical protein
MTNGMLKLEIDKEDLTFVFPIEFNLPLNDLWMKTAGMTYFIQDFDSIVIFLDKEHKVWVELSNFYNIDEESEVGLYDMSFEFEHAGEGSLAEKVYNKNATTKKFSKKETAWGEEKLPPIEPEENIMFEAQLPLEDDDDDDKSTIEMFLYYIEMYEVVCDIAIFQTKKDKFEDNEVNPLDFIAYSKLDADVKTKIQDFIDNACQTMLLFHVQVNCANVLKQI